MVQAFCQILSTTPVCQVPVSRVVPEEFLLFPKSIFHRDIRIDVLLTPVDDSNESQLERIRSAGQDLESIGTGVHEIELGKNTDGSQATRIDCPSQFQGIRIRDVDVGR